MIRKTEEQTAAFVFGNLHEKHRAQLRDREDARAKHLQDYRRKLESVPGIAVRDVPTTDVALPSGETLCAELEDPFDLPDVHESNERAREYRDRWLRDRLRSTPFAAPRECFFQEGGTTAGSWWQLGLPAREDWASDLLYAVAGTRAGDEWSKWLQPACLFIEGRSERWRGWSKMADAPRILGFRRTARTCETFLYSPPKSLMRPRSAGRSWDGT